MNTFFILINGIVFSILSTVFILAILFIYWNFTENKQTKNRRRVLSYLQNILFNN